MKATLSGAAVLVLVLSTVPDSALGHQRSLQNVPFTGIGSVRPLRSSSSFSSSPPSHSTLDGSQSEIGWEPSTNPSSSAGAYYANGTATTSSSSSAVDVSGASTNSSFSSSAVYAIDTVFTNSSVGEGDPESANSSASSANISAVEMVLVETLEVDQQVTGENISCTCMHSRGGKGISTPTLHTA